MKHTKLLRPRGKLPIAVYGSFYLTGPFTYIQEVPFSAARPIQKLRVVEKRGRRAKKK